MATLGEFLSPEAGQERRKWLNETLGYYLPPELRGIVGLGAELNPVTNMERAGTAAQRVADPSLGGWDRMAAAGDMAVNMGAVLAPVAGAKLAGTAGVDGANAVVEALTAASPMKGAVGDFMADEFGGVGFKAYHGSPHDFDRFSLEKIGTGEGAQAYGHGLYFAESEGVARAYRDALARPYYVTADGVNVADRYGADVVDAFENVGGDPAEITDTINRLRAMVQRNLADFGARDVSELQPQYAGDLASSTIDMARRADGLSALLKSADVRRVNEGRMYEVQINADPNDFLDWDKPLSEQPAKVRDAVSGVADLRGESGGFIWDSLVKQKNAEGAFGEHIADPSPAIKTGPKAATEALRRAGIPGIRYLDAGSRGAGDGSRNYVVFDDKLIEILRKYGLAGAVPMGALLGQPQDPMGSYLEAQ